jgi:hypothetical protein
MTRSMILAGKSLARTVTRTAMVRMQYPRMYQQHNTGTDKPKEPTAGFPTDMDRQADASKTLLEKATDTIRKGAEDLLSGIKQTFGGHAAADKAEEWAGKAKEGTAQAMDQAGKKLGETVQV